MATYTLIDGTETTVDAIRAAVEAGTARLVHSNGDVKTLTSLSLDGRDIDTRDECYSAWDEVWTTIPTGLQQALNYAR